MEYGRCARCGRLGNLDHHQCSPVWLVWRCDETLDDARRVFAIDSEEAAEICVEVREANACEYTSHDDEVVVLVVPESSPDKAPEKYAVTSELVPEYNARKIK